MTSEPRPRAGVDHLLLAQMPSQLARLAWCSTCPSDEDESMSPIRGIGGRAGVFTALSAESEPVVEAHEPNPMRTVQIMIIVLLPAEPASPRRFSWLRRKSYHGDMQPSFPIREPCF
jgi:hypothetical protein